MTSTAGRGALVGLALLWLAGCSEEAEPKGPRAWDSCELTADRCSCLIREGGSDQQFPPADSCAGFNCCLLSESDDGVAASCTCSDLDESCEDAAERGGTTVVSQCPPSGELLSAQAACVPESEPCPNRASMDASGCCGSLVCISDGEDVPTPVCTFVAEQDREHALLCERATLTGQEWLEIIDGEVTTSHGRISFDRALVDGSVVGPGGCVTTTRMSFLGPSRSPDGGPGRCELTVDAVLREGEWVLGRTLASLEDCEGYSAAAEGSGSFEVAAPEPIPFGFSHETDFCGALQPALAGASAFCASGSFDWELTGTLGDVTFEGSHLTLRGVVCGDSDDTCEEL